MKPTPYFPAIIEKGDLKLLDRDRFITFIKTQPDGNYKLIVQKSGRNRSNQQNAWYWGVVLPIIAHETGHTCEELHEIFKQMFLPRRIVKFKDAEYEMPGTTTTLTTAEFTEYVERVRAEAANMGIIIPDPI